MDELIIALTCKMFAFKKIDFSDPNVAICFAQAAYIVAKANSYENPDIIKRAILDAYGVLSDESLATCNEVSKSSHVDDSIIARLTGYTIDLSSESELRMFYLLDQDNFAALFRACEEKAIIDDLNEGRK